MKIAVTPQQKAQRVRKTLSVCPVCLKRIDAEVVKRGDDYYIEKRCPDHGRFRAVVWRGDAPSYEEWGAGYAPPAADKNSLPACPDGCGLCEGHLQKTCCALVEVTTRCDLGCPVCFAQSGSCEEGGEDPTITELRDIFNRLATAGNTFVQLSGGEPTIRDDLPEIIAAAKEAGCETIQLNTNGIRLGRDPQYAGELREAGLSFVFMQFDGTEDGIYEKLRGRPLLDVKKAAIANCSRALLGVTLVPTLVPGVNSHNIGEIISFAIAGSPAVRGVHFQPISYFGRYPRSEGEPGRITLPELLRDIEFQTKGKLKVKDFAPSSCDHPYCGFHGDFAILPNDMILRLTKKNASCCPPTGDEHLKNRRFVSRRWNRESATEEIGATGAESEPDMNDMGAFLSRIKSHGFTITAMAFQDAYTLDIERLRRCSLHVIKDGKTLPFCSAYLTALPYN
ncbi:MAG: radical SAM protein [Oscillospiraceae bacterium]|nr:radical SAM protein [Oscillospiraceae bacterium]